jgi:hypothetical protein
MSRLYWHTEQRTAELFGAEYHHLGHLASGPAVAAWDFDRLVDVLDRFAPIMSMIPAGHYLHTYYQAAKAEEGSLSADALRRLLRGLQISVASRSSDVQLRLPGGHTTSVINVLLNTALLTGSDAIRLAAKLYGLGEIHGFIDGPDRSWCADVIERALDAGLYRRRVHIADQPGAPRTTVVDYGWDDVLGLLRERDDGPVVLSYSVTDSFPNRAVAGWTTKIPADWMPEDWGTDAAGLAEWAALSEAHRGEWRDGEIEERWSALPDAQRWALAVEGIRADPWKRIGRDLDTWAFGPAITVYDLLAEDRDTRIAAALEGVPS